MVTVSPDQVFKIVSTDIDPTTDGVTLIWNSELTFSYDIQASSNLTQWDTLATDIDAQGATTTHTFTDNLVGDDTNRYYRVVLTP